MILDDNRLGPVEAAFVVDVGMKLSMVQAKKAQLLAGLKSVCSRTNTVQGSLQIR